jgi:hypothetical protein|tara:strand:- start:364 stop:654 length:291 start_codon:yes stop_codon:yes gene_type:complete
MTIPKIHHTSYLRYTYTVRLSAYNLPKMLADGRLKNCYNIYIKINPYFYKSHTIWHGFREKELKPKHLKDYTKLAIETMGFIPRYIGEKNETRNKI